MPRPEGLTDDQWQLDCLRRRLDTEQQNARRARQFAMEMDKSWDALLHKADLKLELTKSKVAVLKRKEDFMILTVDVSNMTPHVKAAQTS